jgi:transcription factor E
MLFNKKHVNQFIIAKKLNITVNQVRNLLYRLSDHGVVSYVRKKDRRKGWYTYFWRIEPLRSLEVLKEMLEGKISQIKGQIDTREKKVFYACGNCHIEMDEENALLNNFTCPECGRVFEVKDSSKLIKEMKKNLLGHEGELSAVEGQIVKERGKKGAIIQKEMRKEERIKKEARKRIARKARAKRIREKKAANDGRKNAKMQKGSSGKKGKRKR